MKVVLSPGWVRFAGYAAVFGRVDRGGDVVRAGAFARSLARDGAVPLLWEHRPGRVIGRVELLREVGAASGLSARCGTSKRRRCWRGARSGGLSFRYRVRAASGSRPRELHELDLVEVSLVALPMQPLARVHAVEDGRGGAGGASAGR